MVERLVPPIIEQHGRETRSPSISGNPNVHTMSGTLYNRVLIRAATQPEHLYSASTVDQMPKHVSSGLMFGHPDIIPVPDIDRTDYLLMLGANPRASNGSLATAPDWPGRLEAIQERGGRVVVVDPAAPAPPKRPTSTCSSGPAPTCICSAAIVHVLFDEGLVDLGTAADYISGVDEVGSRRREPSPRSGSPPCAASKRRPFADSPVSWPRPRPRRSTAESAPTPCGSARSAPGWSTSSTR